MNWWTRLRRWLRGYRLIGCFYCRQERILIRGEFYVHVEPVCEGWREHRGPVGALDART